MTNRGAGGPFASALSRISLSNCLRRLFVVSLLGVDHGSISYITFDVHQCSLRAVPTRRVDLTLNNLLTYQHLDLRIDLRTM